jgi:hypothetical protein
MVGAEIDRKWPVAPVSRKASVFGVGGGDGPSRVVQLTLPTLKHVVGYVEMIFFTSALVT